ncbi:hypothetical protein [Pontibacillus yanchengensis]|nr:hypothetical protein [Pontibacillus yanchengensis]
MEEQYEWKEIMKDIINQSESSHSITIKEVLNELIDRLQPNQSK